MTHPGMIYKEFRTGRGYSVREAAGNSVTPQFLNKFERGDSDIRFSTLLELLNRINVTVAEFSHQIDATMDKWLMRVEQELDQALVNGGSITLEKFIRTKEKLYEETGEIRYHLVAILGRVAYNSVLREIYPVDMKEIRSYLSETETWGRFELFLISYPNMLFSKEESLIYAQQILKGIDDDFQTNRWRLDAYLHIIYQMIRAEEFLLAEQLWQGYTKLFVNERSLTYLHHDLYGRFIHGLLLMTQGDPEGRHQCERLIKTFGEDAGYGAYANRLHMVLQDYKHRYGDR